MVPSLSTMVIMVMESPLMVMGRQPESRVTDIENVSFSSWRLSSIIAKSNDTEISPLKRTILNVTGEVLPTSP